MRVLQMFLPLRTRPRVRTLVVRTNEVARLSDGEVLPALNSWSARERAASAVVVALIARADAERLYVPAGYPSMHAYCVQALRLSESEAYKRIEVARKAREFPAIFAALEDGRLHMTAVLMLAPYLTGVRAGEMLAAAEHKTKTEIQELIAERFPRTEYLPLVQTLAAPPPPPVGQLAPERVQESSTDPKPETHHISPTVGAIPASQLAPERVPTIPTKTEPIAKERYLWQLSVGRSAQQKLERARELLSHSVPSGDMAEVLERGLEALIAQLEKRKYAATEKPRTPKKPAINSRTIPAHVRRAVRERDRDRCTFVSDNGHRCTSRKFLEFDHAEPATRGGEATMENLRLRCRAHNQYEAERVFGAGFMERKRGELAS
jgi:5-methylcytosine-specific restriction endonuclease McrA